MISEMSWSQDQVFDGRRNGRMIFKAHNCPSRQLLEVRGVLVEVVRLQIAIGSAGED